MVRFLQKTASTSLAEPMISGSYAASHAARLHRIVLFIVLLMALFLLAIGCTRPETELEAEPDGEVLIASTSPLERGQETYQTFCQSCHGEDGKGRGLVSDDLHSPPADLTRLALENNGVFPIEAVIQMVDGRTEVAAHGSREMPVWGNIWSERDGNPVPEEEVNERVNELVEYLRTLQVEGGTQ